ncbi:MOSC domain-containing protein [Paenibacillus sp. MER TA 81-3]|uniref:MOSC domain-containing protein n=1 Tax=Paenibacillus sp. MER TA 81-3 TaxID=2939573 RepID=UPI00203FB69F|nr:MOSC domain-containing protein [Paenibacillus sp. MER TA 81-3]MCM3338464.1 MOSC domain-containing protein [Paenibacillus sp. MER TA 81-3]
MEHIGALKEIVRHPVKSFRGERVQHTKLMDYGLYGDRSHVFLDDTRPGKYVTITQCPKMAQYEARFAGPDNVEQYPRVEVRSPNGIVYDWEDEALKLELEQESKRAITPHSYTPQHVPFGALEEAHILLVTDASVRELEQLWGGHIDYNRFRPNLFIQLDDPLPFVEEQWLGRRLRIGAAELELNSLCERCMIITVDPDSGERDASLLKTVVQERSSNFGVYASVLKTGDIEAGQPIYLI